MTPPAIQALRLRIEHAKASPERRAEIQREMLAEFGLAFRTLSADVGVWEKYDRRRKVFKEKEKEQ